VCLAGLGRPRATRDHRHDGRTSGHHGTVPCVPGHRSALTASERESIGTMTQGPPANPASPLVGGRVCVRAARALCLCGCGSGRALRMVCAHVHGACAGLNHLCHCRWVEWGRTWCLRPTVFEKRSGSAATAALQRASRAE
jgi:hypothetical protein